MKAEAHNTLFAEKAGAKREGGETMNSLDRIMEFLVAGVFLCVGLNQIFWYRRRPKALGARNRRLPLGLPYASIIAIGLFEIVAALALVTPFGPWPPATLALLAATGLALLTLAAAIYRTRRRQSAAPSLALFLMALFVIVGHSL